MTRTIRIGTRVWNLAFCIVYCLSNTTIPHINIYISVDCSNNYAKAPSSHTVTMTSPVVGVTVPVSRELTVSLVSAAIATAIPVTEVAGHVASSALVHMTCDGTYGV